jgi:glycosyltransferase involved in cell wall biosynthesis
MFYTCLAIAGESFAARALTPLAKLLNMERQWQNRILNGVPSDKLRCYPQLEIRALWRAHDNIPSRERLRIRNERFQRRIPEEAIAGSDVVVGFDTSSYILASRSKAHGKKFVLDRSIGHPRFYEKLLAQLAARFPDWEDSRDAKSESELSAEDEEHRLADVIVVPSRFVAMTLIECGVPADKITVNRFGTDVTKFYPVSADKPTAPLVFLFVGALTVRKGLPLLLEAWNKLSPKGSELWIVGGGEIPGKVRQAALPSIKWLGAVSREKLAALFQQASVFICPSFFEGLAQVQIEAAACGLPVIATTWSGGEDIVDEGKSGFVIEPGNLFQLMEAIMRFIECPGLASEMGEYARARSSALSWSHYGDRWQKILESSVPAVS